MLGTVEWIGKVSQERETANITHCESINGRLHILFSNETLSSEGRIAFSDAAGEQRIEGIYRFTDDSYAGTATVVGRRTSEAEFIEFSGIWFDKNDGTNEEWEVMIQIENVSQYTFTYEQ